LGKRHLVAQTRAAEYPRPNYVLLHIDDTHLIGGDGSGYGAVDADGQLGELLD
jgi:Icc protein